MHCQLRVRCAKTMSEEYGYEYYHGSGSNYPKAGYENQPEVFELFRRRVEFVASLPEYAFKRWLDVGCAYGFLVAEANRLGFDAYGADVSDYAISQAKRFFPLCSERFFVSDCVGLLKDI